MAVAAELPLVIVNSQRAGPSTGLPTKTEQSDLYQAVYGRNGDTPVPVVAAQTPGHCFSAAIEAARIALEHMTPVILLTDGYLANASELWPIPDIDTLPAIRHHKPAHGEQGNAFERDEQTLARRWATPGHPGFVHRVGGIEKDQHSGNISYDADNHQAMTTLRADKVARVANFTVEQGIEQGSSGGLAVVAWGSTYGTIYQAVKQSIAAGIPVAQIHISQINPLPRNLGDLLGSFERVLVPELNTGQLATLLRDRLNLTLEQYNKVTGQPLTVSELTARIAAIAEEMSA